MTSRKEDVENMSNYGQGGRKLNKGAVYRLLEV